jgi:hypothetical protein
MPEEAGTGWKNVRIPENVWEAAKIRSAQDRATPTIQEVVEAALRAYLQLPKPETKAGELHD